MPYRRNAIFRQMFPDLVALQKEHAQKRVEEGGDSAASNNTADMTNELSATSKWQWTLRMLSIITITVLVAATMGFTPT